MENRKEIEHLDLSMKDKKEEIISKINRQILEEELQSFPPIKEGDLNISRSYIYERKDDYEIQIYIRNGFDKAINFEYLPLCIVNKDEEIIGTQVFNLKHIGDIPSLAARPVEIFFDKKNIKGNVDRDTARIVFNKNIKVDSTVKIEFEALPEGLPISEIKELNDFIEKLKYIRRGQITISLYNKSFTEERDLNLLIIVRNGHDRLIRIEQLPILVEDELGNFITQFKYELKDENVIVNADKARVFNFLLPKEFLSQYTGEVDKLKITFENK